MLAKVTLHMKIFYLERKKLQHIDSKLYDPRKNKTGLYFW